MCMDCSSVIKHVMMGLSHSFKIHSDSSEFLNSTTFQVESSFRVFVERHASRVLVIG